MKLMQFLPYPGDEETMQELQRHLSPEDALALRNVTPQVLPEDVVLKSLEDCISAVSMESLRTRVDNLRSQAAMPNQDPVIARQALLESARLTALIASGMSAGSSSTGRG